MAELITDQILIEKENNTIYDRFARDDDKDIDRELELLCEEVKQNDNGKAQKIAPFSKK